MLRSRLLVCGVVLTPWLGSALVVGCSADASGNGSSLLAPGGADGAENAAPGAVMPPGSPAGTTTTTTPSPVTPTTPGTTPIVDGDGNEVEVVPDLEDEEEVQVQFELPSAGERYVYAANPDNNSVAVIDSQTLAIQSVEAGDKPTFLQSLGGRDAAVVLNVNSDDATIIRTEDGVSKSSEVDVVAGSNAIAVAPDGSAAVVYFNVDLRSTGPSGSFQDLSVVLLEDDNDRSVGMTVGFRPSAVHFSADSKRAFVVTEDGISILDFEAIRDKGSHIATTIPLAKTTEAEATDVSITPDGTYALSRPTGLGVLRLTSLTDPDAEQQTLDLTEVFRRAAAQNNDSPDAGSVGADVTTDGNVDSDEGGASEAAADETSADVALESSNEPDAASGVALADGGLFADGGAPLGATSEDVETSEVDTSVAPATSIAEALTSEAPTPPPPDPDAPLQFAEITDVDLSPTGDFAIAVFRDRRTVLKVPIPGGFDDLDNVSVVTVGSEIVGSVNIAPNGKRAMLYTTAQDTNEHVTIMNVEDESLRVVRLPKSVRAVTIAPDSESALVVHRKLEGDPAEAGIDPDVLIDRSYGYSVLRLEDGFSKLQLTSSALGASTIVPDGSTMFILFNSPSLGVRDVHRVGLRNFLVQSLTLGSPPISLGAVPGTSKVFVGQDHPDGRITFIDWETAQTESVTGFELNSRIRE
jgi:YVTN family beta-propeller protein